MTLAEVTVELIDNADFEEVGSLSKAKAFATAATRWFILAPQSSSKEGASLSLNTQQIENLLKRARLYIEANDTSNNSRRRPSVRYTEVVSRW